MPEAYLYEPLMQLFEDVAPFDEFQNFGLDPEDDMDFGDVENFADFDDFEEVPSR